MIETETRKVWPNQIARPANCDPSLGVSSPCPHCRQMHLRPGYCQALDPVSPAWRGSKEEQAKARRQLLVALEKANGPMPRVADLVPPARLRSVSVETVTVETIPLVVETIELKPETIRGDSETIAPVDETLPAGTKRCPHCGQVFTPAKAKARYCSSKCRLQAFREAAKVKP